MEVLTAPQDGTRAPAARRLTGTWLADVDLRFIRDQVGTPAFVYSEAQLVKNVSRITSAAAAAGLADRVQLYVPFFPNSNPHVLKPLQALGAGLLLQLPGEYDIVSQYGFDKIIVSPGHVSNEEIRFWSDFGYPTFLSSLDEVGYALDIGAPTISARIDSLDSGKPGIKMAQLGELSALLDRHGRHLECFEVYCGSGNSRDAMIEVMETLLDVFTTYFPTARSVNFAGGHGFSYEDWDESSKHFDWSDYFMALASIVARRGIPPEVTFLFEPARDVLADVGALLLSVKRDVITTPVSSIVATDGSRMLMPSAQLRDRRHNVVFLDADLEELPDPGPAATHAALRGRSILRHDYILPGEYPVPAGVNSTSHVVIMDVGAYCATQHMEFLNIPPAAEVLLDADGAPHLVSSRGGDLDKWRHLLPVRKPIR